MKDILEYINHEDDRKIVMEALKAVSEGLSYDENIFTLISEEELPDLLFESLKDYKNVNESEKNIIDCIADVANDRAVDEGVLAGILGGGIGLAFGPKLGNAICSALGIQKGALYDLLNSRLVTSAICLKLGLRM